MSLNILKAAGSSSKCCQYYLHLSAKFIYLYDVLSLIPKLSKCKIVWHGNFTVFPVSIILCRAGLELAKLFILLSECGLRSDFSDQIISQWSLKANISHEVRGVEGYKLTNAPFAQD